MNSSRPYKENVRWDPPEDWLKITAIDAHTGGEPLRVFTSGFPMLQGETILERREYARKHYDHIRTAMMLEPRGHADMYGCVITEPVTESADFGVLFLHNGGFSTMCGHGIIGVVTVAIETGVLSVKSFDQSVHIDTPAGLVKAKAHLTNDKVASVSFENVPSYVVALDKKVEIKSLGEVSYDLAFGGAYYAFVNNYEAGVRCIPENSHKIIEIGMAIKRAVMESVEIKHPYEDDLGFLYGTIFIAPAEREIVHSRHVCIFADGEVDRSPTGTGVSARMALLHARGEVKPKERIMIESIVGSDFVGKVVKTTKFGPYDAVIPCVTGSAHISGQNEFYIDPDDPFKHGFMIR